MSLLSKPESKESHKIGRVLFDPCKFLMHGQNSFASNLTLYDAGTKNQQLHLEYVVELRSFLLVKTKPGMEKEVLNRFKVLSEVREIHLITGKFDLFLVLESPETEIDPRQKVASVVVEKVRPAGGIIDTRTIIPIDSQSRPAPVSENRVRGFVFIQSELGKEKDLMTKLLQLPEVSGVHLLFGKSDLLVEIDSEKSFVHPPPQHIANLVETKIAKLSGIQDTNTYVPLESIVK